MRSSSFSVICALIALPISFSASGKQIDPSEKSDSHQVSACQYFFKQKVAAQKALDDKTDALVLEFKKLFLKQKSKLSLKDEMILRDELSRNFLAAKLGERVPTRSSILLRQIFKQTSLQVQQAFASVIIGIGQSKSTPGYLLGELNQEKLANSLPQCTATLSQADNLTTPQSTDLSASADRGSKSVGPTKDFDVKTSGSFGAGSGQ